VNLAGVLTLPLVAGVVAGALSTHPGALQRLLDLAQEALQHLVRLF
jgi:hypothetical protein